MQANLIILACFLALSHARNNNVVETLLNNLLSGRIVGGHDAKPGEFPHQVSFQFFAPNYAPGYVHFCGGTIIDKSHILTAAHCVGGIELLEEKFGDVTVAIKAGKYNLKRSEDTEQASLVEWYKIHEKFGGIEQPGPYDIAVLKLKTPLRLNKKVAKINLPKKGSKPTGTATLSGWGAISKDTKNPIMPSKLQTIDVPVITNDECNSAMKKFNAPKVVESNICTGPRDKEGDSACGGDSGGPLILKRDNEEEVIGIVSWGLTPCGKKGAPSVYTRVSSFIDWIEKNIE